MNCPYCETEIDEHEANRCLDAWVAEAVMGIPRSELNFVAENEGGFEFSPALLNAGGRGWVDDQEVREPAPYSISIAAAWEVVGKMTAPNMGVGGDSWKLEWLAGSYRASFGYGRKVKDVTYWKAIADTAPLAICRAALKAAGG